MATTLHLSYLPRHLIFDETKKSKKDDFPTPGIEPKAELILVIGVNDEDVTNPGLAGAVRRTDSE